MRINLIELAPCATGQSHHRDTLACRCRARLLRQGRRKHRDFKMFFSVFAPTKLGMCLHGEMSFSGLVDAQGTHGHAFLPGVG